jgi:hypothetical protein
MSVVVVGLASFVFTGLRYGGVVESRADRLAAADGGMRYAVEQLKIDNTDCGKSGVSDDIYPPDINGTSVTVTCQQIGDGFGSLEGWALVLTGQDIPVGQDLIYSSGATSDPAKVGGKVWLGSFRQVDYRLSAPIEFNDGLVKYTSADCSVPPPTIAGMQFGATSGGLRCSTDSWATAFSEPDNSAAPVATDTPTPPALDADLCTVFSPGYYNSTNQPVLGDSNYFIAGDYTFDGFVLPIKSQSLIAGWTDGASGDIQFLNEPNCANAIAADKLANANGAGATFYMRNEASFEVQNQGSLEILRRWHNNFAVSVHVLDNSYEWDDRVLNSNGGTTPDLIIHGHVWAPEAQIRLEAVANSANGQILGGATIASLDVTRAAGVSGFSIWVQSSPVTGLVQLDSTATLDGVSTTIRSIVDLEPSTRYTAVKSWRVL